MTPSRGSTNWAGASRAAGGPGAGPHRLRSHRDRAVGRLARPGRALTGASTVAVGSAAYQRLTEHRRRWSSMSPARHAGFFAALDLVRPTGTIVLKSTTAALLDGFDMSRLVVDEISVRGSRCGPFDAALRMLASGAVQNTRR
ncbi:MAG: hypothetical protein R2838_22295 [Caldilineaceae bacterium]